MLKRILCCFALLPSVPVLAQCPQGTVLVHEPNGTNRCVQGVFVPPPPAREGATRGTVVVPPPPAREGATRGTVVAPPSDMGGRVVGPPPASTGGGASSATNAVSAPEQPLWRTPAGLTAIAAVITAIGGIIAVLLRR